MPTSEDPGHAAIGGPGEYESEDAPLPGDSTDEDADTHNGEPEGRAAEAGASPRTKKKPPKKSSSKRRANARRGMKKKGKGTSTDAPNSKLHALGKVRPHCWGMTCHQQHRGCYCARAPLWPHLLILYTHVVLFIRQQTMPKEYSNTVRLCVRVLMRFIGNGVGLPQNRTSTKKGKGADTRALAKVIRSSRKFSNGQPATQTTQSSLDSDATDPTNEPDAASVPTPTPTRRKSRRLTLGKTGGAAAPQAHTTPGSTRRRSVATAQSNSSDEDDVSFLHELDTRTRVCLFKMPKPQRVVYVQPVSQHAGAALSSGDLAS